MTEFGIVIATLAALSLTVTKIVDFFRNLLDAGNKYPRWAWNVAGLVIGLVFALGWQINVAAALMALVPALAEHSADLDGVSGQVLTGFIIGMGAGFWHELLDALSSVATKNQALATTATEMSEDM